MVELQIQLQRNKRQSAEQGVPGRRAVMLLGIFIFLVGGLVVAFLILQSRVSLAERSKDAPPSSTAPLREKLKEF